MDTLSKVILVYLIFLAVAALYFYIEIKRSPIYKDEEMRERIRR